MNRTRPCPDQWVVELLEGELVMKLTNVEIAELKKLLDGEKPLATFCDSDAGEKLFWSGLVAICAPKAGIFATVVLSEAGRIALSAALA